MKKQKKDSGITLIALIITIIVLVILVAVSVAAVYNSRIIDHAINGAYGYSTESLVENNIMEGTGNLIGNTVDKINKILAGSGVNTNISPNINVKDNALLYLYNNLINDHNSIDLLVNDSELFSVILSSQDNVDYIINNPDVFINSIISSETAVSSLANNDYAKSKIRQNETWISALEQCDYAYEPWTSPIMSSNTKEQSEGTITITGSGYSNSAFPMWKAMDGKLSGDDTGYWWYYLSPAYWQIEFPYKLRIKNITFYNQSSTEPSNRIITARLYTDSSMSTPIGNQFSANTNWQKINISRNHRKYNYN